MIFRKSLIAILLLGALLAPQVEPLLHGNETNWGSSAIELFSVPTAHAQSNTIGNTASRFFGGLIEIFAVVNWLALGMVQALLNPDFIFGAKDAGGVRGMETILLSLWRVSRDIVNGIFAFMLLIFGASMILMGAEKGAGAMFKEKAPKFVLAVILVNFSWFFPRVILDMSNVMQAVVYQLPNIVHPNAKCIAQVLPGPDGIINGQINELTNVPMLSGDDIKQLCNFVWKVRLFPPTNDECGANPALPGCPRPTLNGTYPKRGRQLFDLIDIYYTDWEKAKNGTFENGSSFPVSGADVVINGLAVNFAKIPQLTRVEFEQDVLQNISGGLKEKVQASIKFFVYLAFHAILSAAIGLILLAFTAVLLVRVAVIWMCVAFMPFIFIGLPWKGTLGDLGHEKAPNIWTKFIQYALLPVFVAIPLSVGFTLLGFSDQVSLMSIANSSVKVFGISNILTGITGLHELLWLFLTLGIIWAGTFSVLESDTFSASIVGGIKGFGENVLGIVKKSALYAPVIPFPGPGGHATSVGDILDSTRNMAHSRGVNFRDAIGGGGGGANNNPRIGPTVAAPTPQRVQSAFTSPAMTQREKQDIADILKNTSERNAKRSLDDFARRLEQITRGRVDSNGQSIAMGDAEARALAINPQRMNDLVNTLQQQNVINATDAGNIRSNSQHFFNMTFQSRVALDAGDTTARQVAQKTQNALQSNVPVEDIVRALKAHQGEREEGGRQVEAAEIKRVIDTIEQTRTANGDVNQALQSI